MKLLKTPSALLPIVLSVAALALVAGFIVLYGTHHQGENEGATAHLWQLLILAHGPAILFFLVKWAPREPRQTMIVFALQIVALAAALSPVYFLGL
jgi:steroid 5-alpha reductase family enzyme